MNKKAHRDAMRVGTRDHISTGLHNNDKHASSRCFGTGPDIEFGPRGGGQEEVLAKGWEDAETLGTRC